MLWRLQFGRGFPIQALAFCGRLSEPAESSTFLYNQLRYENQIEMIL